MRNLKAVYYKEMKSYFNTPMAYIFLVIFSIINGYFFTRTFFLFDQSNMRSLFNIIPLVYLFFIPAITMGLIAREKNIGTKRPGTGISPMLWNDVIGKTAKKDFLEDEIISL